MRRRSVALISAAALAVSLLMSASTFALVPSGAPALDGVWTNVDSSSRGYVKLEIVRNLSGSLSIHAWASCSPSPCDNGTHTGRAYSKGVDFENARAFSVTWNDGIATRLLTGRIKSTSSGPRLIVTSFSYFTDGSNRYNYFGVDTFKQ